MNVINLSKGEKINLSKMDQIDLGKGGKGLKKVVVGLGWDDKGSTPGGAKKGLLGRLFGGVTGGTSSGAEIDCDAFAYKVGKTDKIGDTKDVVWYGNLETRNRDIVHSGDNLVGGSKGDDEQIVVDLAKIDNETSKVVIAVNIFNGIQRRQHFGMLQNAYIRVVNEENNEELVRFKLDDSYEGKTTLYFGELVREGNDWEFTATGDVGVDGNIMNILSDKF